MASITHAQPVRRSLGKRLILSLASRYVNPYTARNAGSRRARVFALVRHHGRRSGRGYTTPVAARPYPGGFMIPLTFGPEADWYRNIEAAGGCVVVWKGVEHALVDPQVVEFADGAIAYGPLERALMPVMGISRFARRRDAPPAA
jgi:deazaflavin-dependent oxidoreductase (nitroreductase family)